MLTKRDNFLETIHGGNPDRFVNQYEFFTMLFGDPIMRQYPIPAAAPSKTAGASPSTGPRACPASSPSMTTSTGSSRTSSTGKTP